MSGLDRRVPLTVRARPGKALQLTPNPRYRLRHHVLQDAVLVTGRIPPSLASATQYLYTSRWPICRLRGSHLSLRLSDSSARRGAG